MGQVARADPNLPGRDQTHHDASLSSFKSQTQCSKGSRKGMSFA